MLCVLRGLTFQFFILFLILECFFRQLSIVFCILGRLALYFFILTFILAGFLHKQPVMLCILGCLTLQFRILQFQISIMLADNPRKSLLLIHDVLLLFQLFDNRQDFLLDKIVYFFGRRTTQTLFQFPDQSTVHSNTADTQPQQEF